MSDEHQFHDLMPYIIDEKEFADVVMIGWYYNSPEIPTGVVMATEVEKLIRLILDKDRGVNRMRCGVSCKHCGSVRPCLRLEGGIEKRLGMSELWIPGKAGRIYAVTTMIYHLIIEHHYQPVQEFLEALAAYDPESDWDEQAEYDKRFQAYWKRIDTEKKMQLIDPGP